MGSQSNSYLTVMLFLSLWLCFLGPLYKTSSVFWIDCLFLASQPPVVKTEMVTISDATQRTEISTKEIPIVQTETKTITYESSQVQRVVCLQSYFYSSYVDQNVQKCFSKACTFFLADKIILWLWSSNFLFLYKDLVAACKSITQSIFGKLIKISHCSWKEHVTVSMNSAQEWAIIIALPDSVNLHGFYLDFSSSWIKEYV